MSKDKTTEEVKTTAKAATRSRDESKDKTLTRKAVSRHGPLEAPEIPGMHQRWVNDSVNRIADMKDLGYEHVLDEKGNPVHRMSRGGDEVFKIFLMKTPDELFEQGKTEKAKLALEYTEAMTAPDSEMGQYGEGLSSIKK